MFIVAVDLYGEVLQTKMLEHAYEQSDEYCRRLGKSISKFVTEHGWQKSSILGVSIATQGTISADGESVDYGEILDNYEMKLTDLAQYIPYPCRLEHDSKEEIAGCSVTSFFEKLRKSEDDIRGDTMIAAYDSEFVRIWHDYLDKLAFAIRNLSIIVDGSIIISGYLAPFFTEDDIDLLLSKINTPPFPITREQIIVGTFGQYAPAAGAAMVYLDQFRKSV